MSKEQQQIQQTAVLAGIIGQIGCITLIIIGMALGTGLFLDRFLETRPVFTILFMVGSVPVTLFVTVRISLAAAARAQQQMAAEAKAKNAEDKTTR